MHPTRSAMLHCKSWECYISAEAGGGGCWVSIGGDVSSYPPYSIAHTKLQTFDLNPSAASTAPIQVPHAKSAH